MKTDSQLKQDVMDELMWEPDINAVEIGVAVKDGVVTLSGYVDSYHEKMAAERAAQGVFGVKAVVQEIKVRLPGSLQRSDEDIAKAAANALAWTMSMLHDRIKVKVQDGWVTLSGQVDWRYQRDAAENAVCNLMGVVGVTNQITVKPSLKPTEIKTKIESAFQRNALLDARRIAVQVRGDKVILEGSVRSYAEKKEAEQAACSAPGICEVENKIVVNP
jgi:osmotically-inducible protein OsmY